MNKILSVKIISRYVNKMNKKIVFSLQFLHVTDTVGQKKLIQKYVFIIVCFLLWEYTCNFGNYALVLKIYNAESKIVYPVGIQKVCRYLIFPFIH